MITTAFTRLCGCRRPLQLAGMPSAVTPELVAAVAREGALAMLPGVLVPAPELSRQLEALEAELGHKVGLGFLMPYLDREVVAATAAKASVVEFFYGEPEAGLVELVKQQGALVSWQVGSVEEALAAEERGCDFVVAQGCEAGGHLRGGLGLFALLDRVLDRLRVPVVAAGGIGSARQVAAALAAGAAAVRVGTRFVAAAESGAHPEYRQALLSAGAEDTVVTEAFGLGWPQAPHRVLRHCIEEAEAASEDVLGFDTIGDRPVPMPRWSPALPSRRAVGEIGAMALYAGCSVDAVTRVEPAADIVRELCDGAEMLLRHALPD